jgi:nucleoside-diphosphate kinase
VVERTLALIKPDSFKRKYCGSIISMIEASFMDIINIKIVHLTKEEAKRFYIQDAGKDHYEKWTDFMSSGKLMALVLEGENVINRWRTLMGATDPSKAERHTIRGLLGSPMAEWNNTDNRNCVHGSDSKESAEIEIKFFF